MAKKPGDLTRREFIQRTGVYSAAVASLLAGCPDSDSNDPPADTPYCDDSCTFNGDAECDDGGTGATYSLCNYGTDCTDCGVRYGPAGYSNQYSNGYSNYSNSYYYSNGYSNYANTYSNYTNTYSNYSNYYSNYSNYYSNYYNYSDYVYYYNYFVNSW